MTVWRLSGSLVLLAGLLVLVSGNLAVTAQDKDKKVEEKKVEAKKEEAKKEEPKKEEPKKEEAKKEEPKKETKAESGKDLLVWKAFEPKSTFYQKLVTTTDQDMKVMGQQVTQKQSQTFYLKWSAEDKSKEGNYVVTQEIIGVKMNINIGGNNIAYDSTEAKQPANPMSDFFKTLINLKLKFTISPKLEVVNIEGADDFVKKLSSTNPQMESLLKSVLSKEALQQMAEPTWGALPDHAVAKGETWSPKKPSVLTLGGLGTYTTSFTYTYDGEEKGKDKIGIKAELKYAKPDQKNGPPLPFTIKDAALQSKEGSGYALFDRAKGRFAETMMKMKLEGDLTIDVSGMETKVSLVQNQEATSTTSDEKPPEVK